jgi:hypothetical protein
MRESLGVQVHHLIGVVVVVVVVVFVVEGGF